MVITLMFLARFDCGADGPATREAAHMNLNTALMSHLQKPPMAPKSTLITFTVHPTFLFAFNLDLLQGLQFPGPCQGLPSGPGKGSGRLIVHGRVCRLQRLDHTLQFARQGRTASIGQQQRGYAVQAHDVHQPFAHPDEHAAPVNKNLLDFSQLSFLREEKAPSHGPSPYGNHAVVQVFLEPRVCVVEVGLQPQPLLKAIEPDLVVRQHLDTGQPSQTFEDAWMTLESC